MLTYCILSPLAPPQLVGIWLSFSVLRTVHPLCQWSSTFLAPGSSFTEDRFSTDWGWVRLFWDDVNTLTVLCTLLLLLSHLLHLRSSGLRSWGLRTPVYVAFLCWGWYNLPLDYICVYGELLLKENISPLLNVVGTCPSLLLGEKLVQGQGLDTAYGTRGLQGTQVKTPQWFVWSLFH